MSDAGYLNNIITDVSAWGPAAVPSTGVFSLSAFNTDPTGFLADFARAKLGVIGTTPTTGTPVIPLPASLVLLISGLGMVGGLKLRRKAA